MIYYTYSTVEYVDAWFSGNKNVNLCQLTVSDQERLSNLHLYGDMRQTSAIRNCLAAAICRDVTWFYRYISYLEKKIAF